MTESPAESARTYVASLTGLRGAAAIFVFLFHYDMFNPGIRLDLSIPFIGKALQFPLGLGWAGVDLFFVLSGFLLTLPFARATLAGERYQRLGRYYKRRLLRVFPAYWAQLAIILAVGAWFLAWRRLDVTDLLAHLGMFFNIGWAPVRPMVGVWWTLPVELSFYLLLPVIAVFMTPRKWPILVLLGIATSMVYRAWSADHFAQGAGEAAVVTAASHLPGSLPEFLLGASAAWLVQFLQFRTLSRPSPLALDIMFLAGGALAFWWLWNIVLANGDVYWQGHWSMIVGPTVLGLMLSLMVISLYWGSRIGRLLFANPVVYFLGLISYSLYLWHFVVMQQLQATVGESMAEMNGVARFLLTSAAVLLVSTASYWFVERPFFRLRPRKPPSES